MIANSQYAKRAINHHYKIKKDKIKVVYTGIDINKRLTDKVVDRKNEGSNIRFLAVGKMYPRKNIPLLVKVFKAVHEKMPNTELHIVGDGIDFNKVKALREKFNLQQSIKLYGFIGDPVYLKKYMSMPISFAIFLIRKHSEM